MDRSADPGCENEPVLKALYSAKPYLLALSPAIDVIPGFSRNLVLHAGPPIAWEKMPAAMQAAVAGALVFEGMAADLETARRLADSGDIRFASAHDFCSAGAMAGAITASMPVFVVEDETSRVRAFAPVNEGFGKALRFGANGREVLERLVWIRDAFAPAMNQALDLYGPMNLKLIIAEALRRGDECHNRNKAATSQFFREIAPALVATGEAHDFIAAAMRFITGNDHFFLSLSMAHAKAVTLAMERQATGTLVTTMAGNGREVGIRVSGLGSRWFTAPAEVAEVRLFEGHCLDEATPTMGDSYVTEVIGLGGFALAAAPAIAEFVGGSVADLTARSERMRMIVDGEHPDFLIPALGFKGVPSGIDVRRVVTTNVTPIVNTGVASRHPGAGQIGAGIQSFPMSCFRAAADALDRAAESPK